MDSLSGKQIKDLKELYSSIYEEVKTKTDDDTSGSAVLTKKDDKNSSNFRISGDNPKNFKSIEAQKEYLKLLNNPDVNPATIDTSKYFADKINKIDTTVKVNKPEIEDKNEIKKEVKVDKPETENKNEVKNKVKPLLSTKLSDTTKLGSTIKPVKPSSARDKMIAKNEIKLGTDRITNLRNQNADFQAMKKGDITKMDFMKQYPNSQTTKKYNLKQIKLGKPIIKSHYEPYDLVLDYVLSEGHAETVEEAHYVMTQMDADTIQGIVEMKGGSPYIINQADVNARTQAFKNFQKGMKNKITGDDLYKLGDGVTLPKV